MIFQYMTLSPATSESLHWVGAYFTCRQLHLEMRNTLKPENDYHELVDFVWDDTLSITPGPQYTRFGHIQEITVQISVRSLKETRCERSLVSLYRFWLKHLYVVLTDVPEDDHLSCLPWGDLKAFHPKYFTTPANAGQVNCKAVTFTIKVLAEAEQGRDCTTSLENYLEKSGAPYTLTIVQSASGQQSERTYFSETRFRLLDGLT